MKKGSGLVVPQDVVDLLKRSACQHETADFIGADPIQFPHRYSSEADIEASGFISAWMAYGSRKVFLGKLDMLHNMMDGFGGPAEFIRRYNSDGLFRELHVEPGDCLYRFYKWAHFDALCSRMSDVVACEGSLQGLFSQSSCFADNVERLLQRFEGVTGVPVPHSTSANKKLYMFLRWMVRRNSPVDFGIWSTLQPSDLIIPLDTHVFQQATALGLTTRTSADLKCALDITASLRQVWPDDPARGDFALYGPFTVS